MFKSYHKFATSIAHASFSFFPNPSPLHSSLLLPLFSPPLLKCFKANASILSHDTGWAPLERQTTFDIDSEKETLTASPKLLTPAHRKIYPGSFSYINQWVLFSRDIELGSWHMQNFQADQKFWHNDFKTFFQDNST